MVVIKNVALNVLLLIGMIVCGTGIMWVINVLFAWGNNSVPITGVAFGCLAWLPLLAGQVYTRYKKTKS